MLPAKRFINFANFGEIRRVTSFVTSFIAIGTFTGKPEAGGRVKLRHAAGPVKLRHAVSQGYPQMGIGREVGGRRPSSLRYDAARTPHVVPY